ncbi:anti-sigma factor antagonist [Paractinoplanes deccanensis]|uniref:Anti-sigma factor antagonist n=1 Tax=Paractinoplanes deccanensis TaxID=113561 RepID=A0ABQ3YBW1_9ACTN|nr:STAS domain-containing protein [Actinoplanes deccanensis]GID77473.1 anti-sigma factor antagonist [Actinoplanes deccanensis]
MKIVRDRDGDAVRVALTGELDLASSDDVRSCLEEALAETRPARLLVDMDGVAFCDSTGIEALILARQAAVAQGTRLELVNVHGIARTTLEITGVLRLFS